MNDLEGRLYRANSKYNQQLTANSALREEIETLRIKHRNFQNKDKKYQKGNYSNHSFMSAKMSHIEPSKLKLLLRTAPDRPSWNRPAEATF